MKLFDIVQNTPGDDATNEECTKSKKNTNFSKK